MPPGSLAKAPSRASVGMGGVWPQCFLWQERYGIAENISVCTHLVIGFWDL